jgi:hypothetical protein
VHTRRHASASAGLLAFGKYIWDEEREAFTAHSISVLRAEIEPYRSGLGC